MSIEQPMSDQRRRELLKAAGLRDEQISDVPDASAITPERRAYLLSLIGISTDKDKK